MIHLITNSRLSAFRRCQRLHQISYVQAIRPVQSTASLEFGDAFHAGLEGWWGAHMRGEPERRMDDGWRMLHERIAGADVGPEFVAKLELLLIGYDARWSEAMADWEVLAVEVQFDYPLRSPSGELARGLRAAGKIDAIARRRSDGTIWLVEHKTSGSDLGPSSPYWSKLRLDSQISLYHDGGESLGYEIWGCLYDVIGKPELRPLRATPEDARKYRKDGQLYANQRAEDETPDEYKLRLGEEIATHLDQYYQRAEVVRLDTELDEARRDTYETALQIRDGIRTGRAPRSPAACYSFGHSAPCAYVDVCSGAASLDDEYRFRKLESAHPELDLSKPKRSKEESTTCPQSAPQQQRQLQLPGSAASSAAG